MPEQDIEKMIPFDYAKFRQTVITQAQKRGAAKPNWDDIWMVMAMHSRIGDVMRDHSIDTAEVWKDIEFTRIYGKPLGKERDADKRIVRKKDLFSKATQELISQLEGVANQHAIYQTEEGKLALTTLINSLYMLSEQSLEDGSTETKTAQAKMTAAIAGRFLATLSGPLQKSTMHALREFQNYLSTQDLHATFSDNPLELLDRHIGFNPQQGDRVGLNANQVFDAVRDLSGPFYYYLLARNGMVVPSDYAPESRMLPRNVCQLAVATYKLADEERDRTITPTHFARILLSDPSVLAGIRELVKHDALKKSAAGDDKTESTASTQLVSERLAVVMQNLRKITGQPAAQKRRSIFEPDEDDTQDPTALLIKNNEEKFRVTIDVPESMKDMLHSLGTAEEVNSALPSSTRLFGKLLEYPEVTALLTQAGVSAESLAKWTEIQHKYVEELAVSGKTMADVDNPGKFKINDVALENMIAAYGRDLSREASMGRLEPVIGRSKELEETKQVLLRKKKRNVCYAGEPGVGKTMMFYGLAQDIINGNVPQKLLGARVLELDLQAMNAGAMYRGQFEERLKTIVDGVAERNASGKFPPIILCIDEIHNVIATGGTGKDTPGAAEILKPALARGDLYVVGATTEREYRRTIEKDGALARRFQMQIIDEPDRKATIEILDGTRADLEKHHNISIDPKLFGAITDVCKRYVTGNSSESAKSPDREISIIDTACSRAAFKGEEMLTMERVLDAVSAASRIRRDFFDRDEAEVTLKLPETLRAAVFDQHAATDAVASAVINAKAGLQDPGKPLGTFLFRGPTGVGKTETAKALAREEFGTEDAVIRINMNEFMEKHSISRLVGSPPGYVGYDEEGQLTGPLSRKPHCVILLDEIEKAHPDVMTSLMTALDEGFIQDAQGRKHSLKNAYVIMTTNHPDPKSFFRPEVYNRIEHKIEFQHLKPETTRKMVERDVNKLADRVQDQFHTDLFLSEKAKGQLGRLGYSEEYGARELKRTILSKLTTPLSAWLLGNAKQVKDKAVLIDDVEQFKPIIGESKEALLAQASADTPDNKVQANGIAERTKIVPPIDLRLQEGSGRAAG